MENQANSKSIILNYGLYLGIASIFIALIKYATGMQYTQEWYSGLLGLLLMIALIVLGIKKFKTDNNGFISFGSGIKIGLGITLIATLIIMVYYALFSLVIEPAFMEQTIETQKTVWADSYGMTDEQIEQSEETTRKYFYLSLFGGILIMNLFLGGIISLITGAVLKKTEENQY
ncbi:uncharacterized protein DUF4199 [Tenacibaculum adriaticum]|uniref:Uncharacterized protein DUF4199 n=1 Tax=Tenacibaculum adriaticum TaxID=413713 RepID=A0A5S5DTY5_9FLAO|nr:DUF4199 domain-containing protein [Tenacibaculum adriaticum]TYP98828.1 uncharacterized protein DUF4199 [Tenacibaculum adriaticum]